MKKVLRIMLFCTLAVSICTHYLIAQTDGKADSATEQTQSENQVGKALKKLKTFNGKPNTNAKFYIYLQSASWCGPCQREMPDIVKEYKKIKKAGGEIILLGCDRTLDDAKNYLKKFRAKFPGIMVDMGGSLPGFKPAGGIPHATFVKSDGSVIEEGHGSLVMKWNDVVSE